MTTMKSKKHIRDIILYIINVAKYIIIQENATPYLNITQKEEETEDKFSDSEMLDKLTTNRGELKIRTVSFRSERWASTATKEVNPRTWSFRHEPHFKVRIIFHVPFNLIKLTYFY